MTNLVASYTPGADRAASSNNDWGVTFIYTGPTGWLVTQLGVHKTTGNLSGYQVRLVNSGNTVLVASATIDLTSSTVGSFTYASVTPAPLTNGQSYSLIVFAPAGNISDTGAVTMNNATTIGGKFSVPNTIGAGSGSAFGSNNMYAGVDMVFIAPVELPWRNPVAAQQLNAAQSAVDESDEAHEIMQALVRRHTITQSAAYVPVTAELPWINKLKNQKVTSDYAFVEDEEEINFQRNRLLTRLVRGYKTWTRPTLNVSRFVEYDVLSPPVSSLVAAKFVQFDILGAPVALNFSKLVEYVILLEVPIAPKPLRLLYWTLFGMEQIDVGYEDVPNLNLRRRIQTPAAAYHVTYQVAVAPPTVVRPSLDPLEESPVNLNVVMRRRFSAASSYRATQMLMM